MHNNKRRLESSGEPPFITDPRDKSPAIPQVFSIYSMRSNLLSQNRLIGFLLLVSNSAIGVAAQANLAREREIVDGSSDRLYYTVAFITIVCIAAAVYLWRKSKKGAEQPQYNYGSRYKDYYSNESYDMEGVDAEKELEWLRKAKKSTAKPAKMTYGLKPTAKKGAAAARTHSVDGDDINLDTRVFQEKMKKLQYAQLPINSFSSLSPSKEYEPLPISNDQSLINAIDQANEEYEEDEAVRDLAVRILTAFRTRNSVEALSQIALYDLSSNLRSKAVSTLTDFDHESVFEAILLACADPTREVRAAAARGLFRLNFDRADAWKRIIETRDEFRMTTASRAAIEAGIVVKSFDRLVHEDLKVAYEAYVLVALLLRAGETKEIFEALREHKDDRVKYALLHVIKAVKDVRALAGLQDVYTHGYVPTDVAGKVKDTITTLEQVSMRPVAVK